MSLPPPLKATQQVRSGHQGPVAATRPPDLPPPVLDWPGAYSLTKPDGGGSSALLTQRVGVQDSAQTFAFRGGEPPLPSPLCRTSIKPLSGPCQALSPLPCCPFLPSANIPAPSTLDAGNPNGTGSAPDLGKPQPRTPQLPSPSAAQTQSQTPGSSGLDRVPEGGRASDGQSVDRVMTERTGRRPRGDRQSGKGLRPSEAEGHRPEGRGQAAQALV